MKIRLIIYLIILVVGTGLFLVITYPKASFEILNKVAPNFSCNLFSGQQSVLGDLENSNCVKNGCAIQIVTTTNRTDCFDCDYYTFKCVPKLIATHRANQNGNNSWTLVSGNPGELCTTPTWRGQAEIKGWYTYENTYVEGTEEWVFNVVPEDQNKFPLKTVKKIMIKYGPHQTEDQLRQTTKDAPISIVIKEVSFYCEGLGALAEL